MPGVNASLNRVTKRDAVTLKASGAETSNTNGAAVGLGDKAVMNLTLAVSASSGTTPTLDVTVEGSNDAGATWYTLGTFAQKTGNTSESKAFLAADTVRYRSVIAGTTPSFTYSITGTST